MHPEARRAAFRNSNQLGTGWALSYGAPVIVIGLLRLVGLLNAAVWFGASFFFLFVADSASHSDSMRVLLGARNFPYFSIAIGQVIGSRFFGLFLICGLLALLHTGAEWLYFGKYPRRVWLLLIFGLFLGGLAQSYGLQPKLKALAVQQYSPASSPGQRAQAGRSYRTWGILGSALNLVLLGGLGVYLWRVANPPDEMRFVGASNLQGQFHS